MRVVIEKSGIGRGAEKVSSEAIELKDARVAGGTHDRTENPGITRTIQAEVGRRSPFHRHRVAGRAWAFTQRLAAQAFVGDQMLRIPLPECARLVAAGQSARIEQPR